MSALSNHAIMEQMNISDLKACGVSTQEEADGTETEGGSYGEELRSQDGPGRWGGKALPTAAQLPCSRPGALQGGRAR